LPCRVAARLDLGVDARHAQLGRGGAEIARGLLHVGSRVGGRQRDRKATSGERARDACGDGRLADAAFAHGHDDTLASLRELCDQRVEALHSEGTRGERGRRVAVVGVQRAHLAECVDAHQPEGK
jgi:hypothetical protein